MTHELRLVGERAPVGTARNAGFAAGPASGPGELGPLHLLCACFPKQSNGDFELEELTLKFLLYQQAEI